MPLPNSDIESVVRWWNLRDDATNVRFMGLSLCNKMDDLASQKDCCNMSVTSLERSIKMRHAKLNPCFFSTGQVRTEKKELEQLDFLRSHNKRIDEKYNRLDHKNKHTREACPNCHRKDVRKKRRIEDAQLANPVKVRRVEVEEPANAVKPEV
jgi:hypothetical protein